MLAGLPPKAESLRTIEPGQMGQGSQAHNIDNVEVNPFIGKNQKTATKV